LTTSLCQVVVEQAQGLGADWRWSSPWAGGRESGRSGTRAGAVFVAEIGEASRFRSAEVTCSWAGARARQLDLTVLCISAGHRG
jgi:hypothetical protein